MLLDSSTINNELRLLWFSLVSESRDHIDLYLSRGRKKPARTLGVPMTSFGGRKNGLV